MLGGYRYVAVALGLVVPVVSVAGPGVAQTPEGPGVPHTPPPIEGSSQPKADSSQRVPEYPPFNVRVLDNPGDAEHTKEREAKSDQHDASDLEAQWEAAHSARESSKAAYEQASAAWWQVIFTAIGTGLLVWNLWETRRSADAASAQVRLMQEEQRTWLQVVSLEAIENAVETDRTIHIPVQALVKNIGKSPALETRVAFVPFPFTTSHDQLPALVREARKAANWDFGQSQWTVSPGDTMNAWKVVEISRDALGDSASFQLFVLVVVEYQTKTFQGKTGTVFHCLNVRVYDRKSSQNIDKASFIQTVAADQWMT